MNRARLRAVGAASLIVLAVCVPAEVRALTSAELTCLDSIGQGGARFAQRTHAALIACDDAIVVGGSCNTQQRDAVIALAARRLGDQLATDCKDVQLEHLGFPGMCNDPDGPPFSVAELTAKIRTTDPEPADRGH